MVYSSAWTYFGCTLNTRLAIPFYTTVPHTPSNLSANRNEKIQATGEPKPFITQVCNPRKTSISHQNFLESRQQKTSIAILEEPPPGSGFLIRLNLVVEFLFVDEECPPGGRTGIHGSHELHNSKRRK